jgi:hypothetical protein
MGFTLYKSTDASAPTVDGQAGSLITLLNACLVNGYGSKTAAEWTSTLTGTNKAAYQQGAGSGFYYRVNDAAAGTGGAKEALVKGFETMSDVDTGTGPFPTTAQCSLTQNSLVIRKSTAASATVRPWTVYADSRTAYIFIQTGDIATTYFACMMGDIYSYAPVDAFNAMLIARNYENNGTYSYETFGGLSTVLGTAYAGHFLARSYTQAGGSIAVGKHGDGIKQASSVGFIGTVPFTNGPDGGLYMCPAQVHEAGGHIRGRLRGCYVWLHPAYGIADGDTFDGSGDFATKSFEAVSLVTSGGGVPGVAIMETSDTLDTNT